MAKSKYAPALFEKLQQKCEVRRHTGIPLPRWWKGLHGEGAAERPSEPADRPASSPPPAPAQEPESPAALTVSPSIGEAVEAVSAAPSAEPERTLAPAGPIAPGGVLGVIRSVRSLVRFDGRRFDFSLNPIGVVILAGGLLLVLFGSYQLGKRSAPSRLPVADASAMPGQDAALDVPVARSGNPDSSVAVSSGGTESSAPPVPGRSVARVAEPATASPSAAKKAEIELPSAPSAVATARVPGLNYIVVERFQIRPPAVKTVEEAKAQAEKAQKWLAEHGGLPTAFYPMSNGKGYELWTVQGFKHPEQTPQREELADKIRSLGKVYAKEGRYLFGCEVRKYQGPAEGRGRSRE